MGRRSASDSSLRFFAMIPRRSVASFFAAVFFIFAPLSTVVVSSFEPQRPPGALLVIWLTSGLLAVCWAATFVLSRRFIAGIVLFQLLMFVLFGPWGQKALLVRSGVPSVEGVATVVSIVAGYVLFVVFLSGQGRTTLRLLTEMALARQMHEALVPPLAVADARCEALGVSVASSEMGGDLIDIVRHGDATDVILADVSGHGVRAGVVMGLLKGAMRSRLLLRASLGELLGDLNTVLEQTTASDTYATLAGLRIHHERREVEYVLAGHHPVLHYRRADGAVRRLESRNMPLGLFAGRRYATRTAPIGPGDLLVLYTDGLNETANGAEELLGHEAIEECVLGHAEEPLERIRESVLERVRAHGEQADDRSLLLVRIR